MAREPRGRHRGSRCVSKHRFARDCGCGHAHTLQADMQVGMPREGGWCGGSRHRRRPDDVLPPLPPIHLGDGGCNVFQHASDSTHADAPQHAPQHRHVLQELWHACVVWRHRICWAAERKARSRHAQCEYEHTRLCRGERVRMSGRRNRWQG